MSIQRPTVRRPKTPKIKKPLISKRKRVVKKAPTLSVGRIKTKTSHKKHVTHKKSTTILVGTCYLEENCKGIISRKVTKTQCKRQGGKSWKKADGTCTEI